MMKNKDFHDWLSEYFCVYLPKKRNFSDKTVKSYKDSFNLLREYFDKTLGIKFIDMNFDSLSKDNVYSFLLYLKHEKENAATTVNSRLSAIKSLLPLRHFVINLTC